MNASQSPLFYDNSPYRIVNDGDSLARSIANRHYSRIWRGNLAADRFIGPGVKMAILGVDGDWLFVWRLSRYRKDGQAGVECTLFRNESAILSSSIILWAEAAWDSVHGPMRKFTYVNPRLIKTAGRFRKSLPGYCFRKAGWEPIEVTTARRLILLAKEIQ